MGSSFASVPAMASMSDTTCAHSSILRPSSATRFDASTVLASSIFSASVIAVALAVAAIAGNELVNKGKTVGRLLRASPALFVYYHVRLLGFLFRRWQLRLGGAGVERVDPAQLAVGLPRPPESAA